MSTHITIPCPKCQERLRVRREYLGKKVSCRHCHATFEVTDPEGPDFLSPASTGTALGDVDEASPRAEGPAVGSSAQAELEALRAELELMRAERDRLIEERDTSMEFEQARAEVEAEREELARGEERRRAEATSRAEAERQRV